MPRLEASLSQLRAWDRSLCVRFNHGARIAGLRTFFRGVSRLGDGVLWYALMIAMLADGTQGVQTVLPMAATGFACTLIYKWLKSKTSRPRPYEVVSAVLAGATPLDAFSFPSGHTLHAVAFTMVAVAGYPWLAWLAVPFTLLVAASRVMRRPSTSLVQAAR